MTQTLALYPGQSGGFSRSATPVGWWLVVVCALVFAMVVLGGVTRLTESGLSIVDWRPFMGVLPPLNEAAWREVFERYRAFPEYQKINAGMTLDAFKSIFWFEYAHRLLGRVIGIAFLLPFLFFLLTGRISGAMAPRLVALFVLGGLQGLLGWFMVQSGLVDQPDVSQYRLAAHLGLAVLIYGYMLWTALSLLHPVSGAMRNAAARTGLRILIPWIFVVILSGGFVAGTNAGFAYNTFPLMDGRWVPLGLFDHTPTMINFFENTITIQFTHRVFGIVTVAVVLLFWLVHRWIAVEERVSWWINALAFVAIGQVLLGIATLIFVVPVPIAAAHQAGGMILFSTAILALHATRRSGR